MFEKTTPSGVVFSLYFKGFRVEVSTYIENLTPYIESYILTSAIC